MGRGAAKATAQVGLQADVNTRGKHLVVAEKQLVEIARALRRKARLLIMDEPTATLTPGETKRLFALMAQLKADGVTLGLLEPLTKGEGIEESARAGVTGVAMEAMPGRSGERE